jgi:predicted  nucleic acid-binding Zn-ribbon protein
VDEQGDRDERITALEADVAALRSRLNRAEQDAAAARVLAGGADRDVADLGGEFREFRDQNNRVLSAMRADLVDLRERTDRGFAAVGESFEQVDRNFEQVNRNFEQVNGNFEQVDRNFLTVHGKLDGVAAGLQVLTDLLTRPDGGDRPGP